MHGRAPLLLLLIAVLVVELELLGDRRSHPSATGVSQSAQEAQARRALTLLDLWSQSVVPNLLLQRSQARALRAGDRKDAATLERRIRRGLLVIREFAANAARDPALGEPGSPDVRATRAAAAAWSELASELLRRTPSARAFPGRRLAELEANAIRLHQTAYDVVDASLLKAAG